MSQFEFVKPLGDAWERMVGMLFRPFNWRVWAKLGLLAWLACLFEGGGCGMSISDFGSGKSDKSKLSQSLPQWLLHPTPQQLSIIIGVAVALVLLLVVIGVVACWIKCRGRFMFIDGLVKGLDTPFLERWAKFRAQGNSLFLFVICWFLVTTLILLVPLGAMAFLLVKYASAAEGVLGVLFTILIFGLLIMAIALASSLLLLLIVDFGTVLMYKRELGAWAAARRVLTLVSTNIWTTVKYILTLTAIGVATMLAVIVFLIATCCCIGSIILSIPYVWALVMLPALAFRRLFTIHFIARAGEDFDLLSTGDVKPDEAKGI
jgi:hypothetical protein